jgi:pSer/pThr/pTyr-binding forkhead associated (FHA) protein
MDVPTLAQPIVEHDSEVPDAPRAARPASPILVVERGPNVGSRYALAPGVTTVGRDPSATVFLNDISVSRRHATIASDGRRCVASDENSLNGTYLNGRRMESESRLTDGDQLQVGRFRIVYLESAG